MDKCDFIKPNSPTSLIFYDVNYPIQLCNIDITQCTIIFITNEYLTNIHVSVQFRYKGNTYTSFKMAESL